MCIMFAQHMFSGSWQNEKKRKIAEIGIVAVIFLEQKLNTSSNDNWKWLENDTRYTMKQKYDSIVHTTSTYSQVEKMKDTWCIPRFL